jgi:hypothetical protein
MLEEDPTRPRYLPTETGVGYHLQTPAYRLSECPRA